VNIFFMKKLIGFIGLVFMFIMGFSQGPSYNAKADNAFQNQAYFEAIDLYKKAYSKEKNPKEKARLIFKIGESYEAILDYTQSEVWFSKAIKARYPEPIVYYKLALALQNQGVYKESIRRYEQYFEKVPDDPMAKLDYNACKAAQSWVENPTKYIVDPEIQINSPQFDFSPVFAAKDYQTLVFTSSRAASEGAKIDNRSGENYQDVYITKRDEKGKWSEPRGFSPVVNSKFNEGAACFSHDMETLFFTRCIETKDDRLGCDIFYSKKMKDGWEEPVKLEIKPQGADSVTAGHPTISKDGMTLIFASDLPGGKGGRDLWMIKRANAEDVWSDPVNLGDDINTPGDELFPYLHANGDLYFASNGHRGMGGLDIYHAVSTGLNQWAQLENMRYPINSGFNDYGIIFEEEHERGYLTSNRPGTKGQSDIWSFRLPPLIYVLQGNVYDKETEAPVSSAFVRVAGTDGSSFQTMTDDNGGFYFDDNGDTRYINDDVTYSLVVSKGEDYLVAKDQITTVDLGESTTFIKEFFLQPINDDPIELPEVQYELDKARLLENSKDSLDYLYDILTDNPTIIIELQAHTDSRASDEYNLDLSQRRAQSCVDYLISKGIDPERMVPRGFGETRLRVTDEQIAMMPTEAEKEAAHQRNRRTEFIVISFDYIPKEQ
jgi:peptidoglycan-associated lipoprotein